MSGWTLFVGGDICEESGGGGNMEYFVRHSIGSGWMSIKILTSLSEGKSSPFPLTIIEIKVLLWENIEVNSIFPTNMFSQNG